MTARQLRRVQPVWGAPYAYLFSAVTDTVSDWRDRALCGEVDGDIFFPEKGGSTREAKKVCMGCEVRAACLEWALDNEERHGVLGGKSERERRKIARDRDREAELAEVS